MFGVLIVIVYAGFALFCIAAFFYFLYKRLRDKNKESFEKRDS